jgi:hypothetical protein
VAREWTKCDVTSHLEDQWHILSGNADVDEEDTPAPPAPEYVTLDQWNEAGKATRSKPPRTCGFFGSASPLWGQFAVPPHYRPRCSSTWRRTAFSSWGSRDSNKARRFSCSSVLL